MACQDNHECVSRFTFWIVCRRNGEKTCDVASAEKGERLLGAIAGTLAMKLRNRELWSLPWQSDPPEP
jgi:hypothetical protein